MTHPAVAPEHAFALEIPVRIADLSPAAHISNVAFVRYADEARMAYFGAALRGVPRYRGGLLEVVGETAMAVVARTEIEYRREVFPDEGGVTVRLWIPYLGGSSLVVAGEVSTGPHPAPATVFETTVVFVERATGTAWTMNDQTREVLAAQGGPRPALRGRVGL